MTSSTIFLLVLLALALLAKNNSLIFAIGFLLVVKIFRLGDKLFPLLESKGINIGVTIITIAVLVPIATGAIGFKELTGALKSPMGWIAICSGLFVALLAKNGIEVLSSNPHITTALVFVFQKLFQFVWDKFTPQNKTTRKVKKYGKIPQFFKKRSL